ncbi:pyridoxal phosphate-dependent decarboxylase family protein [Bermanella sp. R86510]|uniref:pyridoxal phosphate-dependent decarboxylase family protein n=1 Tax=unclassified Bermanella TaxID=2627862 RepID=UPI0037C86C89
MFKATEDLLATTHSITSINTKPETQFLFNRNNLGTYRQSIEQGLNLIEDTIRGKNKPFTGITPKRLAESFSQIDLDTCVDNSTQALEELEELYLRDAVYFHHPKYVAHLNCPIVYPALLAELILSAVNTSVDTWDQSAGGTLIEQALIDWTIKQIGFTQHADGIFTSGGTQSNLMALLLARDHYCHQYLNNWSVKHQGLPPEAAKFKIFTTKLSHFSVQKSAALLGLGYDAVIPVDYDENFCMDSDALQEAILACKLMGDIPMAVVATLGTTDFGSIDPIVDLHHICNENNIWLHADAAYGCGLLVSPTHKHKLKGIELADSVTVDYHKSFYQPVSCGAFFTRRPECLAYVSYHADYLNPRSATEEGTPNLVNKSIQTTRRFDALKLWLTLRIMGPDNLGAMFDDVIALAQRSYRLLASDSNIDILNKPSLTTLIFRFHPAHSSHKPKEIDSYLLNKCNEAIRKALFKQGDAVIASTKVNGETYLKFTLLNPCTSIEDIKQIIGMIKHEGDAFFHTQKHTESTALI